MTHLLKTDWGIKFDLEWGLELGEAWFDYHLTFNLILDREGGVLGFWGFGFRV